MANKQESDPPAPPTDVITLNRPKLDRLMHAGHIHRWLEPISPYTVFPRTLDLEHVFAIPLVAPKTGILNRYPSKVEEWFSIQSKVYNVPRNRGMVLMLIFPVLFERTVTPHYIARCRYIDRNYLKIPLEELEVDEDVTRERVTPDQGPELEERYVSSKRFTYMALAGKTCGMPLNYGDPVPLSELSKITA
jgi:hypothetical protein